MTPCIGFAGWSKKRPGMAWTQTWNWGIPSRIFYLVLIEEEFPQAS